MLTGLIKGIIIRGTRQRTKGPVEPNEKGIKQVADQTFTFEWAGERRLLGDRGGERGGERGDTEITTQLPD